MNRCKNLALFLAIIAFLQVCGAVNEFHSISLQGACTMYASPSGTGTACSSSSPCSLDTARQEAQPGDVVCLRPGNYGGISLDAGNSGTPGNYITYMGDPATVSSRASDWWLNPVDRPSSSNRPILSSFTISGDASYIEVIDMDFVRDGTGSFVRIQNGNAHHINLKKLNSFGYLDQYLDYSTGPGIFIDNGDFHDILVEDSYLEKATSGIMIDWDASSSGNIAFKGNHINNIAGSAIRLTKRSASANEGNFVVEGNHIHNQKTLQTSPTNSATNHGSGIAVKRWHVTIRSNVIHDGWNTRNIYFYNNQFEEQGYQDMLVEYNLIYDPLNNVQFTDIGNNVTIRHNTFVGKHQRDTENYYFENGLVMGTVPGADPSTIDISNNIIVGRLSGGAYESTHNNVAFYRTSQPPGNVVYRTSEGASRDHTVFTDNFFVGSPEFTFDYSHGLTFIDEFTPRMDSDACPGGDNPLGLAEGEYIGALPCEGQQPTTCADGETRQCGTTDVGECQYGVETCSSGNWSSCSGSVGPEAEVCDGKDNDCDGIVDNGGVCGTVEVPTDFVAYWKFDGSLLDQTGNHNGSFQGGTASYVTGQVGQSIELSGNGQFVDCGSDESTNLTGSLSITAWIKPDGFGQAGWGRIVDRGDDIDPNRVGYSFFLNQDNSNFGYVVYGGLARYSDPNAIRLGEWQHVAVSFDETAQELVFYVNGEEKGRMSHDQTPLDSAGYPLVIGIRDRDKNRDFDGSIDEVRIYNRALSAEEIQAIFNYDGTECVDTLSLIEHINQWKHGQIGIAALLQKIAAWKAGTGC